MDTTETKLRKRSEIPAEDTWDLTHIFPSEEDWNIECKALSAMQGDLKAFEGHLGESADTLLGWFRLDDTLSVRASKLYGYASCHHDEDVADPHYVELEAKACKTLTDLGAASAFADPEIQAIPQETLEQFLKEKPELEEYHRSLELIRRAAKHTLSEKEEAILAAAQNISQAGGNISSMIDNADLVFPDVSDSKGQLHCLSHGSFIRLLESSDRTLRKNAFETYYKSYGALNNTLACCLNEQFKQLQFFSDLRHYDSMLEASLFTHEVPVAVYHNLIKAVHSNLPAMYRYMELRKKLLGLEELHMYDVHVPVVEDCDISYSFDEARSLVLDALSVLGSDYTDMLKTAFDNRWIDKYENIGKRSGAYSTDVSRPHPYILLNFEGNLESAFTLAHELGHSMHSYLSMMNQPVSTSDYVIFVAEVASTVNEVLLQRYLMEHTTDRKQKAFLINHFLNQFKSTLYRQTMFAEFELEMGQMTENGQALTAQALNEKYYALNQLYFGPGVVSDDAIGWEWSRIPHFYYDFYVFQYATGFSAAVAIAERILKEGEPAVADYKKFLSGGCSTDPISLLRIAGVDMSTDGPVNSALALFDQLITELETM